MAAVAFTKYVLDTNCFVDASRNADHRLAFEAFCLHAAPGLYLSAVVAAELRAGAGKGRALLERLVFAPYVKRQRIVAPSVQSWNILGDTLATLVEREGLVLKHVSRSFIFDILIAHSCREAGAVLVSSNTADLERIARVFPFKFAAPYPMR